MYSCLIDRDMIVIKQEFAIGFILSLISLYIHWPFCKSKCPYCDFNSHVRDSIDQESMIAAYKTEIDYFDKILSTKTIDTIFFGGGTPSLADPNVICEIINHISKRYRTSSKIEITMEANPTSIESEKFSMLSKSGVNRISIGVQSLREENLKFLGREHSSSEALEAIDIAHKNFEKVSLDFIYALPNQSMEEWQSELEEIYKLSTGHISLYQLIIEKGTRFYKDFKEKKFHMPQDDLSEMMYIYTSEFLESKQIRAYEVSNYSITGQECRHNLNYWNYGDYVGIGAGAHGRYNWLEKRYATQMISNPEDWLSSVKNKGSGLQKEYTLSSKEITDETIIMGLRLSDGIKKPKFINSEKISFLENVGLLVKDNDKLKCSTKGRLVLNSIVEYLTNEN